MHSRSQRGLRLSQYGHSSVASRHDYRACSKSSFRCDTGFPATTFREKCCCTASVAPTSTVSSSAYSHCKHTKSQLTVIRLQPVHAVCRHLVIGAVTLYTRVRGNEGQERDGGKERGRREEKKGETAGTKSQRGTLKDSPLDSSHL